MRKAFLAMAAVLAGGSAVLAGQPCGDAGACDPLAALEPADGQARPALEATAVIDFPAARPLAAEPLEVRPLAGSGRVSTLVLGGVMVNGEWVAGAPAAAPAAGPAFGPASNGFTPAPAGPASNGFMPVQPVMPQMAVPTWPWGAPMQ